ncbi:hypothetical protein [Paenibacillus sp. Soil522]|uniref:hypothetical protein n=1 Tax=Paenibacillus sp. Soil522 TaxID=1736388 RepID=UPI0006F3B2F3|nr:hypothetical protein [Paenibacillus sp. Soil522]KRE47807.1 hypothetical protein ASG81_07755 [Paenibacillus sp. Soil522]
MTFKHPDMERSVRGKTLGVDYTEERIKERIQLRELNFEESKRKYKYRFAHKTSRNQLRTLTNSNAADAKRKNVRRDFRTDIEISKLSNQLKFITEQNLKSRSDLKQAADEVELQMREINSVLKEANEMNRSMKLIIQTIDTYNK